MSLTEIGNELFRMNAVNDRLSLWSKRPDSANTGSDFFVVMHRLGIIGRKHDLCPRQLAETHADPIGPALTGVVWARPSTTVVDQAMLQVMVER